VGTSKCPGFVAPQLEMTVNARSGQRPRHVDAPRPAVRASAAREIDADRQRFLAEVVPFKGIGPAFIAKPGAAVLALA
jgi:hypothetical protein